MAIDKSTRQHYEMQGKVKNYLGKQKMVKAPKYWLSKPGHIKAKLAYITDEEEQILIDKNLYGSLRGRPNVGPAGLPSLQGGDFGGSGGGAGGGAGEGQDRFQAYQGPARAPSRVSPMQSMAMTGTTGLAGKTQTEAQQTVDRDQASIDLGTSLHGGPTVKEAIRKADIKNMIKSQQEEKYGVTADPTKFGERAVRDPFDIPEDERTIEDKLAIENWEKAQDYDKVKDLASRGHDFKEIQDAMDKGLLTKTDPRSMQTQGLLGRGLASLRNIMPETRLEKSLLGKLTSSLNPKSMAMGALKNMALRKLGLGALNPILGIASLFGFDPFKGIQTAFTNKFAKKPVDMSAFNKLGLYDTGPVDSTLTARDVGTFESDTPTQIALGKKGVFESGRELLGLKGKDTSGEMYFGEKKSPMPENLDTEIKSLESFMSRNPDAVGQRHKVYLSDLKTARHNRLLEGDPNRPGLKRKQSWEDQFSGITDTSRDVDYASMLGPTLGKSTASLAGKALLNKKSLAGRALGPVGVTLTVGDLLGDRATAMRTEADKISALQGLDQTQAIEDYATKMYKPYARGGRIDKPLMGRSRDI